MFNAHTKAKTRLKNTLKSDVKKLVNVIKRVSKLKLFGDFQLVSRQFQSKGSAQNGHLVGIGGSVGCGFEQFGGSC